MEELYKKAGDYSQGHVMITDETNVETVRASELNISACQGSNKLVNVSERATAERRLTREELQAFLVQPPY